jgi:signal transduction histidine kinase/ActR/RegA family two-component response regulator
VDSVSTIDLVVALSDRSCRAQVVEALAAQLGVEAVLLFVRDPALGALLPAPGLPQTLRGGRTWRSFISSLRTGDRCEAEVELPAGTVRRALALTHGDTSVVLLGGAPRETEVGKLKRVLPLLAAMLAAEQHIVLARAEAGAASDAASRAEALAAALEAARADASALNAELREEHRRKDEFLAMLGHELRNPLAPIVTSIQLLRMKKPEQPLPAGLVDIMARQTAQLARLVDDLLDVSRVSRGQIELKRQPVLLADVLRDALEESRGLFVDGGHEVIVSGLDEGLTVNGDRARLTQVFGNLLTNAAKYTDRGGRVTVSISGDSQNAIVRVQDNGIGMSSVTLPRIFDLFAQAPVALARAQGGLGIGLTLVRTLVELHGGRVTAASEGLGRGSTFSVSLPLDAVKPKIQPKPLLTEAMSDNPLSVLIVDDNRDAADSIAALLRSLGHQAHVVYDGDAAIQCALACDADLILLDIGLPGMDGYEVARRLRPKAKAGARIVALTGYGGEEGKRRSREAGFDAHVVKPVTSETLEQLIVAAAPVENP